MHIYINDPSASAGSRLETQKIKTDFSTHHSMVFTGIVLLLISPNHTIVLRADIPRGGTGLEGGAGGEGGSGGFGGRGGGELNFPPAFAESMNPPVIRRMSSIVVIPWQDFAT